MRVTMFGILVGVALWGTTGSASEQWRPYVSHSVGFTFSAPGAAKVEKGIYDAPAAAKNDTATYAFNDINIEYKVIVVDTRARANEAATLLGEAQFYFQEGTKLLDDAFGRVDGHYGRKVTVDLPNNGGRSTAAFYFVNGRIISLQATVPAANASKQTPELARFIDSITFSPDRAVNGAIELPPPG